MQHRWSSFILLFVMCFVSNVYGTEYIVKIKKGANFNKVLSSIHRNNLQIASIHKQGRLAKISIDPQLKKQSAHQLALLNRHQDVEYVVENAKLHAFDAPNDARYSEQWALAKINALSAWGLTQGSNNVVVAVIDTGVAVNHEDLARNIWVNSKEIVGNNIDDDGNGFVDDINGWDFHKNDNSPVDETSAANPGHGTHCAGIIGAVGNNQVGISGISQHVSIMPIRFLGADGSGDLFSSTKAIDYAIANGAHIISASWGASIPKSMAQPIIEAIERANQKGVLFVAAAGNEGANNDTKPSYPANAGLKNVVNVAASNSKDAKPTWSNKGKLTVDLASPGENILSTVPNNAYTALSGTSMATPLVAGLAALLKSQDASLTPAQIKAILQSSGTKIDLETACNCRIDAASATAVVSEKSLTLVPAAGHIDISESIDFSAWGGEAPYTFSSSNTEIASITAEGKLSAIKKGQVKVIVKDAKGNEKSSYDILVDEKPNEGNSCPFSDPMMCLLMCIIAPESPWCDNNGGGGTPGLPPEFPGLPEY